MYTFVVDSQAKVTCLAEEKEAVLYLILASRGSRSIVFCNAVSAVARLRSLLGLLQLRVIALQVLNTEYL